MGQIIGSKTRKDGKIIYEVMVDYEESLNLKGHIQNIHIFSEDVTNTKTQIASRGKAEATKYFLIPKALRENMQINKKVRCQKIDGDSKIIFVYLVDKMEF